MNPLYVLIHSPLVGPLTWQLVAEELRRRGADVFVPTLTEKADSPAPFWQQHATAVAMAVARLTVDQPLVLVGHSGAGPLLPAIRQALPNPIAAYLFVDAGIPRPNATRLELMHWEDPAWAAEFEEYLRQGNRYPTWSVADLQEIIPEADLRQQMVAELQPRDLAFFGEPLPVFSGWPDAPCAYLHFSPPYNQVAQWAKAAGWPIYRVEAGHFHMLVDPVTVANIIYVWACTIRM